MTTRVGLCLRIGLRDALRRGRVLLLATLVAPSLLCAAPVEVPAAALEIRTADIDRFYAIYDAAGGKPDADQLQRLYVDVGTEGLQQFAKLRGISGVTLAAAIMNNPGAFELARQCLNALPAVRVRLVGALATLKKLYPGAALPPLTLLIGRGKTGGTTSASGVLIGVETICAADFLEPDLEDRLVHLISHEYVHVQQSGAERTDRPGATVLFASLIEGGAEFVGELISGGVSYAHLRQWTKGREGELEQAFRLDRSKTDLGAWLYNGPGDAKRPGDLGYWLGYRIAKGHWTRARNKRKAIAALMNVTPETAESIFEGSGLARHRR